jgi:hypothetical protein
MRMLVSGLSAGEGPGPTASAAAPSQTTVLSGRQAQCNANTAAKEHWRCQSLLTEVG